MSGVTENSSAGDTFGASAKRRDLLSPRERRLAGLKHASDQAAFEVANVARAMSGLQGKLDSAIERHEQTLVAYNRALAELEAK